MVLHWTMYCIFVLSLSGIMNIAFQDKSKYIHNLSFPTFWRFVWLDFSLYFSGVFSFSWCTMWLHVNFQTLVRWPLLISSQTYSRETFLKSMQFKVGLPVISHVYKKKKKEILCLQVAGVSFLQWFTLKEVIKRTILYMFSSF